MSGDNEKEIPVFRIFNLVVILVCGLISILTGVFMNMKGELGRGLSRGRQVIFNGKAAIVFGIFIAAFPIYIFVKRLFKKVMKE